MRYFTKTYRELNINERIEFKRAMQVEYWLQGFCGRAQMMFDESIINKTKLAIFSLVQNEKFVLHQYHNIR